MLSRRRFLKGLGVATAFSAASAKRGFGAAAPSRLKRQRKGRYPNVLVVMSDQHRADFMGCAGATFLRTPGWDRMASEGVRMSNAYCGFPVCCPSRMSFLAGRRPSEIDCNDNVAQLPSDVPTVAHGFAAAGYETVLAGRMHLIGFDQRHGFSQRIMSDVPGTAFFNAGSWGGRILGSLRGGTGGGWESLVLSGPGHSAFHTYDSEVVQRSVSWLGDWVKRPAGERNPFFLVVGGILPHPPFVSLDQDYQVLKEVISDLRLPDPQLETLHPVHRTMRDSKQYARAEVTAETQLRALIAYAANCVFTDRMMQRLLRALDDLGLAEDTIVVYTSDHGEQMGAHGLWGKNAFYEESTRIPLLCRWPGVLPAGVTFPECVSLVDVGSTLLRLAGLNPLPRAQSEGFASLLTGKDSARSEQGVIIEGIFSGETPARTLRRGRWRYSCYHGMEDELYDLQSDPGEFRNLATDPGHRNLRDELAKHTCTGWDPDRLREQVRARAKELPLIRSWIDSSMLPEPDAPWHGERSLVNYLSPL